MGVYRTKSHSSGGSRNNKVEYWRDSYNYREEYFKKNPGLFGCIWFCSQCGKPLFGRSQVQVDHIIPPSKFSKKVYDRKGNLVKNTSYLAEKLNTTGNLVAICPECNRNKSNSTDTHYLVRGYTAKALETVSMGAQKGTSALGSGVFLLARFIGLFFISILTIPFGGRSHRNRIRRKGRSFFNTLGNMLKTVCTVGIILGLVYYYTMG